MSLDGYIASEDDTVDWLAPYEKPESGEDYGYQEFYQSIDSIVMGRKTYDTIKNFSEWPYGDKKSIIFGKTKGTNSILLEFSPQKVELALPRLQQLEGKGIWILGGGQITKALIEAELIDEYIITIIPIMLGNAIPLFLLNEKSTNLELKAVHQFGELVQTHYIKKDCY